MKKLVSLVAGLLVVGALSMGCMTEVEPGTGTDSQALLQYCPAIAILCIEGYHPKSLPNCNQICVPNQGHECDTDRDCGGIYCITSPCEQPVCRGHQCRLPTPAADNDGGGQACGDIHCGQGSYCCNASCGICAPDGGGCIQIACLATE